MGCAQQQVKSLEHPHLFAEQGLLPHWLPQDCRLDAPNVSPCIAACKIPGTAATRNMFQASPLLCCQKLFLSTLDLCAFEMAFFIDAMRLSKVSAFPRRGTLLDKGVMPERRDPNGEVRTDAYSVSQFFKRVCAPR